MGQIPGLDYMGRHVALMDISDTSGAVRCPCGNCVFPESEGTVQNDTEETDIEGKPSETFSIT